MLRNSAKMEERNYKDPRMKGMKDVLNLSGWLFTYFIMIIPFLTSGNSIICRATQQTNLTT